MDGFGLDRAALMRLLRRRTLIITLFAFGALPLGAGQAAAPRPWATVNVCDTTSAPNTIGIRAWIPGARSAKRPRSLRFVVQYYSETEKRWLPVAEGGDSGYLSVGTGT